MFPESGGSRKRFTEGFDPVIGAQTSAEVTQNYQTDQATRYCTIIFFGSLFQEARLKSEPRRPER